MARRLPRDAPEGRRVPRHHRAETSHGGRSPTGSGVAVLPPGVTGAAVPASSGSGVGIAVGLRVRVASGLGSGVGEGTRVLVAVGRAVSGVGVAGAGAITSSVSPALTGATGFSPVMTTNAMTAAARINPS